MPQVHRSYQAPASVSMNLIESNVVDLPGLINKIAKKVSYLIVLAIVIALLNPFGISLTYAANYVDSQSVNTQKIQLRFVGDKLVWQASDFQEIQAQIVPEKMEMQLIQASIDLRHVARELGTGWPIHLSLATLQLRQDTEGQGDSHQSHIEITDVKDARGDWRAMTVGNVIQLISREIDALRDSAAQPTNDFLVANNDQYQSLLNFPLDIYSFILLQELRQTKLQFTGRLQISPISSLLRR